MNETEVIGIIVSYYNLDVRKFEFPLTCTAEYICENIPEEERKRTLMKVFETFVPTYANPFPKVYEFAQLSGKSKEDIESKALKAWELLERKSFRYASFVTDDSAMQTALASIGGWVHFCDRTVEEQPFMKKDFIRYYIAAYGKPAEAPRVFRGELDNADQNMIYVGNKERLMLGTRVEKTSAEIIKFADKILAKIK